MRLNFLIIIFFNILSVSNSEAQSVAIKMNNIEHIPNTGSLVSFLNIDTTSNCLMVQTSLAKLIWSNYGKFNLSCLIDENLDIIKIILYPNPVFVNAKIKLLNYKPIGNKYLPTDIFELIVYDVSGRIVLKEEHPASSLMAGIALNVANFISGNYFIIVKSKDFSNTIKFIKIK